MVIKQVRETIGCISIGIVIFKVKVMEVLVNLSIVTISVPVEVGDLPIRLYYLLNLDLTLP